MASELKKGDRVSWKTSQGRTRGSWSSARRATSTSPASTSRHPQTSRPTSWSPRRAETAPPTRARPFASSAEPPRGRPADADRCTPHAALRNTLVRTLRPSRRREGPERGRLHEAGDRPRAGMDDLGVDGAYSVSTSAVSRRRRCRSAAIAARRSDRGRHRRDRHALPEPSRPRRGSGRGGSHERRTSGCSASVGVTEMVTRLRGVRVHRVAGSTRRRCRSPALSTFLRAIEGQGLAGRDATARSAAARVCSGSAHSGLRLRDGGGPATARSAAWARHRGRPDAVHAGHRGQWPAVRRAGGSSRSRVSARWRDGGHSGDLRCRQQVDLPLTTAEEHMYFGGRRTATRSA